MTKLSGTTLLFAYDSGLQVRGLYERDSVTWEALSGPSTGARGTERAYTHQLGPGVHFVSWIESSGTTVSQVLDLQQRRVVSFVTFGGEGGRQGLLDHGSIEVLAR